MSRSSAGLSATLRSVPDCEVIIAGAGVVGLTLAALLARGGVRVALVDPAPLASGDAPADYDLRTFAITRASERILQSAGAWPVIADGRHGAFRRMEVWDAGSGGRIRFDSAELAEPALGYIVEQQRLRAALETVLVGLPTVVQHRGTAITNWGGDSGKIIVYLADGRRLSTNLLVGADGAESHVRQLTDIGYQRNDYQQHALVCNVRTALPHEDTARQRFLPTGPLAFLPLDRPDWSSIVWSTTPAQAAALQAADPDAFCLELSEAFEGRLGAVIECGARAAFPLFKARAEAYVRPRLALVGDAAHSIHPLAGQGANLGLLDAAALAEVVIDALQGGRDPGALRVLRRYERWRKGENLAMQALMDGFKALFGHPSPAVRWGLSLGLKLTDRAAPVKALIMRHAMGQAGGLAGDLPRFAAPARL